MNPSLVCVIAISRIAIPDITAPAATEQLRVIDSVKVGEVKGNILPIDVRTVIVHWPIWVHELDDWWSSHWLEHQGGDGGDGAARDDGVC